MHWMPLALKGLWDNATPKLTPEVGKYGIVTILLLGGLFVAVVWALADRFAASASKRD